MPIQKLLKQDEHIRKFVFERDTDLKCLNLGIIAGVPIGFFAGPGQGKTYYTSMKMGYNHGRTFYTNFTSFKKPEEVVGAYDLIELKNGKVVINCQNFLPGANGSILDEAGRGQSVKDILLPLVNEGIYTQDGILMKRPFRTTDVFLSNTEFTSPDDEALDDRIVIRHFVDDLKEKASFDALWMKKGKLFLHDPALMLSIPEIETLRNECNNLPIPQVVMDGAYEIKMKLEIEKKISVSPRTYTAGAVVVAANAILRGSSKVEVEDLEVLSHVFAVRKVNYHEVKNVVLSISNAELDRIHAKVDAVEKIHEEWDMAKATANHRAVAASIGDIKKDLALITPRVINKDEYTKAVKRIEELHQIVLKQTMKQIARV